MTPGGPAGSFVGEGQGLEAAVLVLEHDAIALVGGAGGGDVFGVVDEGGAGVFGDQLGGFAHAAGDGAGAEGFAFGVGAPAEVGFDSV